MAKQKYEVITKAVTVYGAKFGEVVELDEKAGKRMLELRYVKASQKKKADKAEPLIEETVDHETPKNKSKDKK